MNDDIDLADELDRLLEDVDLEEDHKILRHRKPKMWDEYVLFKFKLEYSDEYVGERPEYEISVCYVIHNTYDKHGEFCDLDVEQTVGPNSHVPSYWPKDPVYGHFDSIEEAEFQLTIKGWKMEEATARFKTGDWLGRTLVSAYALSSLSNCNK